MKEITTYEGAEDRPTRQILANFKLDDPAGAKKLFNAVNCAVSLADSKVTEFTAIGIILNSASRIDKLTGEVTPYHGTTIITEEESYYTESEGIYNSMKLAADLFPVIPHEGLKFELKEINLDNKRTLKYLEMI